jgi:histone H3/H4
VESRSPKVRESLDAPASVVQKERSEPVRSMKSLSEREKFILGLDQPAGDQDEREEVMTEGNTEKEVLVVASKLKNYIRTKSGMNTSAAVIDVLSDKVRELCDQAVESAKRDGRKTVMDRDFS